MKSSWEIHIRTDTMLKFGALFDLAKYLKHTLSFSVLALSLSRKLIELGSWNLAHC